MAQPEPKRALDLVEPAIAGAAAAQTAAQTPDNPALVTCPPASTDPGRAPYFDQALRDAERLMTYAAEIGIDVGDDIRKAVVEARTHSGAPSNEQSASLLTALTKLAATLRPVTAESLVACSGEEEHTVRGYWKWAMCLAAVIVPFSVASFVTSAISDAIRKDIVTANELAVKLTAQLRPPQAPSTGAAPSAAAGQPVSASSLPAGLAVVDVISELQQLASTIRAVDGRARQLNTFVFHIEQDPYADIRKNPDAIHTKFQLPAGLPNLVEATDDRIRVYQDVRYFAQSLLDDVSFFFGAITSCLLPVLYALLGTCAYLLRSFEDQMRSKTFIPSVANSARFLIAGIGGAVVGLFNNFSITQGASIPPLAIAFLVGYAVDVFFSFLEGLLQAFTKTKTTVSTVASMSLPGAKSQ
jgi:hypothetical protein